ncbi:hypothetical protein DL98DRAFT_420314, partial [Cadophora sp. DSE1049]
SDLLVQSFLKETNFHYCCLYPQTFTDQYSTCWEDRAEGRMLCPEFTCLLLRVCACSFQYLAPSLRQKIELELGERAQNFNERCHQAARHLSNAIHPGQSGLTQIQQLFLTSLWHKAEARFVESWHLLASSIHNAQELGRETLIFHAKVSEFETEMRRRVWCLLYAWDWQMSILLSRPWIINENACLFKFPSMRLENLDDRSQSPSPIAHMVLECHLGQELSKIPGVVSDILSAGQAETIQVVTEKWTSTFPPEYKPDQPDLKWDEKLSYVKLGWSQLHVVAYLTILAPLKCHLVRHESSDPPSEGYESKIKAVDTSILLMGAAHRLFDCVFPARATFHMASFLVFDTASFLCAALIGDNSRRLPRRDELLEAVRLAMQTVEKLSHITKTGAICYVILQRLLARLSLSSTENRILHGMQVKITEPPLEVSSDLENRPSLPHNHPTLARDDQSHYTRPAGLDHVLAPELTVRQQSLDFNDFSNADFGEFNQIWDWDALGLDFDLFAPTLEDPSVVSY